MLEGFEDGYTEVNGTRLHYVIGGEGEPLVLMEGWPRTTHALRGIMAPLARHFRVIAVDYRGMGGSDKPAGGYDKKNMAKDVYELVRSLGYEQINIAGGDMGSTVAYSFAANYPEATRKLAVWEGATFTSDHLAITAFPQPGGWNAWWYSLSHVEDLPAKLLAGRFRHVIDWAIDHFAVHPEKISEEDRAIYAAAYDDPDAVRASFATYAAIHQDLADGETYPKLAMPVLGLGGPLVIGAIEGAVRARATDTRFVTIEDTGHYLAEEQPEALAAELQKFFG
ncbi:alpha/beta fold hydrolase [Actinacidiphila glaucinigra]|uniref:alpha/beta fold hydrolase n=1 Tax=Actinacidiphila glaucinigra TaxID=235986 RepID=UPI0037CC017A